MDMAAILEREMGDRLSFIPSGEAWIDVVPRGVNKATGRSNSQVLWHSRDRIAIVWRFYERLRYAALCAAYIMDNARYALKTVPPGHLLPSYRAGRSEKKCVSSGRAGVRAWRRLPSVQRDHFGDNFIPLARSFPSLWTYFESQK